MHPPEAAVAHTGTITHPATVTTVDVVLDGAATFIEVYDDVTKRFLGRLGGALGVGTHSVPTESRGGTFTAFLRTDGSLDATQVETGSLDSKVPVQLDVAWTADEPSKDLDADLLLLTRDTGHASGHRIKVVLKDLEGTILTGETPAVRVLVSGRAGKISGTGDQNAISEVTMVAGVAEFDIYKDATHQFGLLEVVAKTSQGVTIRKQIRLATEA